MDAAMNTADPLPEESHVTHAPARALVGDEGTVEDAGQETWLAALVGVDPGCPRGEGSWCWEAFR